MSIKISLTDFIEFVIKSGTPKLSHVRKIKKRDLYSPSFDYWKQLRDTIVEYHKEDLDLDVFDTLTSGIKKKSKSDNYIEVVNAYKKFLRKKEIIWVNPISKKWKYNDLEVNINPEIGIEIDGKLHIIKLYFKSDTLSKSRVELILTLMNSELRKKNNNAIFSLLDIRRGKLYSDEKIKIIKLLPLIKGEAMSLVTIWNSI